MFTGFQEIGVVARLINFDAVVLIESGTGVNNANGAVFAKITDNLHGSFHATRCNTNKTARFGIKYFGAFFGDFSKCHRSECLRVCRRSHRFFPLESWPHGLPS